MDDRTAPGEADLRIERVAITHPDAQLLVEAVQEEYVARYGSRDDSPIDPRDFEDPLGRFFVGRLDGAPVATGAWRRSSVPALGATVTAEVKRMYVVPAAQRRGIARRMLAHLEVTAAEAGIEALVLETGIKQPEAIELYLSSGYEPIPGFGYHRGSELSRCFARRI
jgi:GNAT superfamily N-acetyltransferase